MNPAIRDFLRGGDHERRRREAYAKWKHEIERASESTNTVDHERAYAWAHAWGRAHDRHSL